MVTSDLVMVTSQTWASIVTVLWPIQVHNHLHVWPMTPITFWQSPLIWAPCIAPGLILSHKVIVLIFTVSSLVSSTFDNYCLHAKRKANVFYLLHLYCIFTELELLSLFIPKSFNYVTSIMSPSYHFYIAQCEMLMWQCIAWWETSL
jgi:hypothetical protein